MERLLDVLALIGIVLIFVILRSVRRANIRVEHSVSWLAAAAAIIALSRSEWLLEHLRQLLGLSHTALALLFAILIVFLGVFYRQSRAVSELKDMNITLTQRVAILEYHLRSRDEDKNQARQKAPDQHDDSGRG